jgi:hypothetical protein
MIFKIGRFSNIDLVTIKTLIISTLMVLLLNSSFAQSYLHTTLWTRLQISKQFNPKWSTSVEYQHRRQSNYFQSKFNPLPEPLLNMQRVIVNYRPRNWLYSIQIAHFRSHQLLGKEADFDRPINSEFRFTPSVEYFYKQKNGQLQWRTQYEYRVFPDRITGRFRTRLLERFTLNKTNELLTSIEPLFSFPPNRNPKWFDQMQLTLVHQHIFNKHLRSEFGYRYLYRQRRTTPEIDHENAIIAGLLVGF